ncbi:alpha-glucosidase C-terminal domain-containing protein [Brachyspira sp.]|uniref:alpha-glucosidase C-terminal domain-containing protein n=1 Tax=Brachyspira sp. TaxID=1977261 RepID=UPI0026039EC8|nr:alpha-glucosidase C-terminal domain-containing protein [Brachyspira sp.]
MTAIISCIEVIYNYKDINAKNNIKDSIFNYYKNVLAFIREYNDEKILIIKNFYANECKVDLYNIDVDIKNSKCILSNYDDDEIKLETIFKLKPYESIILYYNE